MPRCVRSVVGSVVVRVAAVVCGAAVWLPAANAADAVVVAPECSVRSAPFEVAPEIGRVHAGDKLQADDQPQGTWRRVKLPDGRFGVVHDQDLKVASVAPAVAPAPAAGAPQTVTAKVNVFEVTARATPATDAPVLKVFAQGQELVVSSEVQDGWRRVQLPDGQTGFMADAALKLAEGAPAPPQADAAPPSPMVPPSIASAQGSQPPQSESAMVGVMFEMMPVGTLKASSSALGIDGSADTAFALAIAPFVDVPLSPNFTIGASPQIIFHVKASSDSGSSATEYDLRARLTGRYPVSPTVDLYGRFSPAYSIISVPSDANGGIPNPKGLATDFAVGVDVALLPQLFLVVDLGYQVGFQSTTLTNSTTSADVDLSSNYLHLGAGLALRL